MSYLSTTDLVIRAIFVVTAAVLVLVHFFGA